MKKNTTYNPNSQNRFADSVILIFSLFIIGFSSFLFYKNLNRTFIRKDKVPIATISYKYNTVQRKLLDRAVWDRPLQDSAVYNGDTIRTALNSEAVITMFDKSTINLDAGTMIQVFKTEEEDSSVRVESGSVSVQTAGTKMLVQSGSSSVVVAADSVLYAEKHEGKTFTAAVEKGEAAVFKLTENGKPLEESGQAAQWETLSAGQSLKTLDSTLTMVNSAVKTTLFNTGSAQSLTSLEFKWHSPFPEEEKLILETASDYTFTSNVEKHIVTGLNSLTIEKPKGTLYWRLYSAERGVNNASAAHGKMRIVSALPPELLEPLQDSSFLYAKTEPLIHFNWKGNEAALSYLFEVSDNPDMQNPAVSRTVSVESAALSNLAEGTWYWRVTPKYPVSAQIADRNYKTSFFHVKKTEKEYPITAISPQKTADTSNGKNVSFFWKNVSGAAAYKLYIADNSEMQNPIVEKTVTNNYFELSDSARKLPTGIYYWKVEGFDKNGMILTESKSIQFSAGGEQTVLRPVFPPDGYTISDSLCADTRFTWKTNWNKELRFQVSASKNFTTLTADIKTAGSGISGAVLKEGEYYWRLYADKGTDKIISEPRHLIITPPLDKPELIDIGKSVTIFPTGKNKFAWKPVKGADYYQVKIKDANMNAQPLYENLFVTGTEIEIALQDAVSGNYIISVQGFSQATPFSGRRYSIAEDRFVELLHLKPAELLYPADKEKISGENAILNPGSLKWTSIEQPSSAKLILQRVGGGTILSVDNPDFTVPLPPLHAGTYRWRVTAKIKGGFDISSKKDNTFTVLPVQPLETATFVFPGANTVLNASFFKKNASIKFAWNKVPNATHYIINLYGENKKSIFKKEIAATSRVEIQIIEFKNLSALSRGSFTIEVRAQQRIKNGIIFKDGKTAVRKFQIDLPKSKKVETDETGVMYGQ